MDIRFAVIEIKQINEKGEKMTVFNKEINQENLIEFGMQHFATETYANKLIQEDGFGKGGASLSQCSELFEAFDEQFPNALDDKEVLKAFFMHWLPLRVKYLAKEMIDELKHYKELHCAVTLHQKDIKALKTAVGSTLPTQTVSLFWSSRPDTYDFRTNPNNVTDDMDEITVTTSLNTKIIDWHSTFLNRMDYINGDNDQEFVLFSDSEVTINNVK